jgi:predicted nucleotidyltransferase/DNA-binding XRE family transcriptional regulator
MWISSLNDLSERFKRARIASRLTQREAAAAAGVSPLLVSQLERGALTELGAVKLLSLLRAVGLEMHTRPAGHPCTLNDIAAELGAAMPLDRPQRVRHAQKRASRAVEALEQHATSNVPAMIERQRGQIARLCERYGVRELALFGSILRSDFDPASSDVDAAVKFGPPADDSLARQYFDFKTALEHLLSRPVDLVELEAMPDTRLKRIIEHTKVSIYVAAA